MARQLLILRHAKSDWGSPALPDFERPLNKRGEKAATLVGDWMKRHKLGADIIISSTALRARQTIERVCQALHVAPQRIHWEQRLYLADVETLLEVLTPALAQAERVLVVGHNPGLEELLVYLCGRETLPRTQDGKLLTTANLAHILLQDDDNPLRAGAGQLQKLLRPKEIAAQD